MRTRRFATTLTLLVAMLGACDAADDGTAVRDRDGTGELRQDDPSASETP